MARLRKTAALLIALLLAASLLAWSQSEAAPAGVSAGAPRAFRGIELGLSLEQVKQLLQKDPLFSYRGDPNVSLLPSPQQALIECSGSSYIKRAFFQFHEQRLYVIILALDPQRLDYYTMFTTLTQKYGSSARLNPTEVVWEFEQVRLSLERPLSVKYLDTRVFTALREQGQARQSLQDISRKMFLDQF